MEEIIDNTLFVAEEAEQVVVEDEEEEEDEATCKSSSYLKIAKNKIIHNLKVHVRKKYIFSVAVKLGVGVLILIGAYYVCIKKHENGKKKFIFLMK